MTAPACSIGLWRLLGGRRNITFGCGHRADLGAPEKASNVMEWWELMNCCNRHPQAAGMWILRQKTLVTKLTISGSIALYLIADARRSGYNNVVFELMLSSALEAAACALFHYLQKKRLGNARRVDSFHNSKRDERALRIATA